jgi:pyridoxamine 5'-phosphate oxidase
MNRDYPSNEFEGPKIVSAQIMELRKEYALAALDERHIDPNPFAQFDRWFKEAIKAELPEPNAMHLCTISPSGKPSGRIVLLKAMVDNRMIFYTNYASPKALALESNPYAALTFFWPDLERQVRIEGYVEKISQQDSADYFRLRPRESQISAWASPQSRALASRQELEELWAATEEKFAGVENIPLPPNWGGFALSPNSFEFWQGRKNRLHDRLLYTRNDANSWHIARLAP